MGQAPQRQQGQANSQGFRGDGSGFGGQRGPMEPPIDFDDDIPF
jgi:single-strand DNA-binding protein